jgi:hypothetical protein
VAEADWKGGTEVFWEIVAVTSAVPFFSGVVPVTLALIGMTCGVPWHTMRLPLGGTPVLPLARTRSFLLDWTTETETMAWKPGSQVAVTESRALAPSGLSWAVGATDTLGAAAATAGTASDATTSAVTETARKRRRRVPPGDRGPRVARR